MILLAYNVFFAFFWTVGRLLIKFHVTFPEHIDEQAVQLISKALGPAPSPPIPMEDVEEVFLQGMLQSFQVHIDQLYFVVFSSIYWSNIFHGMRGLDDF